MYFALKRHLMKTLVMSTPSFSPNIVTSCTKKRKKVTVVMPRQGFKQPRAKIHKLYKGSSDQSAAGQYQLISSGPTEGPIRRHEARQLNFLFTESSSSFSLFLSTLFWPIASSWRHGGSVTPRYSLILSLSRYVKQNHTVLQNDAVMELSSWRESIRLHLSVLLDQLIKQ